MYSLVILLFFTLRFCQSPESKTEPKCTFSSNEQSHDSNYIWPLIAKVTNSGHHAALQNPKPPSLQELKPLRSGEAFSKSIKARLPCAPAHRKYPIHHVFLRKDTACFQIYSSRCYYVQLTCKCIQKVSDDGRRGSDSAVCVAQLMTHFHD